jgi:Flp pilus assembly protein CpaB
MKNKIFTILGICIFVVSVASYFLFDINIRKSSTTMGVNVLIAKDTIPEGFIIRDAETANKYFGVIRLTQNEVVPSAISVSGQKQSGGGFFDQIKSLFSPTDYELASSDLTSLAGRKVTQTLYKNQQVIASYLTTDLTDFAPDDRLFAIPTAFQQSVGAEVHKGDYVDIWITYTDKTREGMSEKILSPVRVVKLKDANNEEIGGSKNAIPQVIIVKVNEAQIKMLSEKMKVGDLFLVKWGVTPSQDALTQAKVTPPDEATVSADLQENEVEDMDAENGLGDAAINEDGGGAGEETEDQSESSLNL